MIGQHRRQEEIMLLSSTQTVQQGAGNGRVVR